MRLACTYFLSKKYESRVVIRRSCTILSRSHERICDPGKSNFSRVTGGLITATIPMHLGKTFIHSSDPGLLRSMDSLFFILNPSFGGPYD